VNTIKSFRISPIHFPECFSTTNSMYSIVNERQSTGHCRVIGVLRIEIAEESSQNPHYRATVGSGGFRIKRPTTKRGHTGVRHVTTHHFGSRQACSHLTCSDRHGYAIYRDRLFDIWMLHQIGVGCSIGRIDYGDLIIRKSTLLINLTKVPFRLSSQVVPVGSTKLIGSFPT
jgi:hypothetical protein